MNYKILGSHYWTPPKPFMTVLDPVDNNMCIGIVAIESHTDGSWKCYVGCGAGDNDKLDEQLIAANGMPIGNKSAACGFFPHLDEAKFQF